MHPDVVLCSNHLLQCFQSGNERVSVFPVAVLCSSLLCGKGKKSGDENIPSLLTLLRQTGPAACSIAGADEL